MKMMLFGFALVFFCVLPIRGDDVPYGEGKNYWELYYGYGIAEDEFPYHPTEEEYYDAVFKGGAKVAFDILVVDEDGKPMEGATVGAHLQGNIFDGKDFVLVTEKTDARGLAHVEGKCGGKLRFWASQDGYYDASSRDITFFYMNNISLKDGKWQPYGTTYKLVLRPIRNRIPMYPPKDRHLTFPEKGIPVGLDLFVGDWVKPYGKGETVDLFLQYDFEDDEAGRLESMTFTFPNPGDGVYRRQCFLESAYHTDYNASTDDKAYESRMTLYRKGEYRPSTSGWATDGKTLVTVAEDVLSRREYLVFRTRTERDERGTIVSCHYSKTQWGFDIKSFNGEMTMRWLTNPTPNDTNLEEKPNRRYDPEAIRRKEEREAEIRARSAARERRLAREVRRNTFNSICWKGYYSLRAVDDFLDALSHGEREAATTLILADTGEQKAKAEEFLDKAIVSFSSGEVASAVEFECFRFNDADWLREFSVVPVRWWHLDNPEAFEIKPACVVRCDGSSLLLPDFEHPEAAVNGLDADEVRGFQELMAKFEQYRNEPSAVRERRFERVARHMAIHESSRMDVAKGFWICAVDDFLDALRHGEREAAAAFVLAETGEQKERMENLLDKAIPFFTSGRVSSAVEPECFWKKNAMAVIPIRQWRPDKPEVFEIEPTCLVRRSGGLFLLPDFEHPGEAVNGLNAEEIQTFQELMAKFQQYKNEKKAEMKRE